MLSFSFVIGIVGIARGLGSLYPELNLVAGPFVCPSDRLAYKQQSSQVGGATYWTVRWACTFGEHDAVKKEIDSNKVFLCSGVLYGVVMFAILLLVTYVYWNSSMGPARNDGLKLW